MKQSLFTIIIAAFLSFASLGCSQRGGSDSNGSTAIQKRSTRAVTALRQPLPLGAVIEAAKETMTEWALVLPAPRSDLSTQTPVRIKGAKVRSYTSGQTVSTALRPPLT